MPSTLRLMIPGLFGPRPESGTATAPAPRLDALRVLLSRADAHRSGAANADETLFDLFGVRVAAGRDLPVAPLTRLADTGIDEGGTWLRADPVHLIADLHQVLLYDARRLGLDSIETRMLVEEFNRVFAADGLVLDAPRSDRWYIRLREQTDLRTSPLFETIGRDINPYLPRGRDAPQWRRLLTEVQMLFHDSEVNREREAEGRPTVNGIWPWGCGVLPDTVRGSGTEVLAADPLALGLARLAGLSSANLPDTVAVWRQSAGAESDSLVVLEHVRYAGVDKDVQHWRDQIQVLERDWFIGCRELLSGNALDILYLYPCNGWTYRVRRSDLRRFWRRSRPLVDYP